MVNPNVVKHAMYYGMIMAGVLIINFLLGIIPVAGGFLQLIGVIAIIYLGYKFTVDCRDRVNGGQMTYGVAFWYETQLFMYGLMVLSVFKFLFFKFIKPNMLDDLKNQMLLLMDKMNMSNINEMKSSLDLMLQPVNYVMLSLFYGIIFTFILSLITAFFVKKEKNIFEQ